MLDRRILSLNAQDMSRTKRLLIAAMLLSPSALRAGPQDDLPWIFTACAGRYSAEIEHAWILGRSETTQYENQKQAFVTLAEAITPDPGSPELLNHRIEAKYAQARLLTLATFQTDPKRARLAQRMASTHINACKMLLLGG